MRINRIQFSPIHPAYRNNNYQKPAFRAGDSFELTTGGLMDSEKILNELLDNYKNFEEVEAIGIGGSSAAKTADKASDIDVYLFVNKDIPLDKREAIVKSYSSKYEVGGEYFGPGDEFYVDALGREVDLMYFNKNWFEETFENIWVKHYPANGYTTCFLYTLSLLNIINDKNGWLQGLKDRLNTPYPEELKNNIIKRNLMLLKDKPFASYYEQIEKAVAREDFNSVNHRSAAFLASYFDIIFAVNKMLHPGEKRLVNYAKNNCKILPENFEKDVNTLALGKPAEKLKTAGQMVERLRKIL